MQNAPGRVPFYASSNLTAPTDMYFSSAGQPMQATLDLALTSQKNGGSGADFFGYYLTDATGAQISTPAILLNSSDALGSTVLLPSLSAGQNYAFFIENIQGYGTSTPQTTYSFYMNSSANSSTGSMPADSLQHFSIFQAGNAFYLGAVDGDACAGIFTINNSPCIPSSQFDYNDMVVQVSPAAPEPVSAMLSGLGMLVLGLAVRRRFSTLLR
jgi:hypothetical protein